MNNRHTAALLCLIAATIAVLVVALPNDEPKKPAGIVSTVDTSPKPGVQPQAVTTPAPVVNQAADQDALGSHKGERSENPVGVTADQLEAGREQQERLATSDQLPIVTPLAAPFQPGCRTQLVVNASTRRGVRPRLFVLHYTVSPNRPGISDVNAVVSLFNRPAFAASSNYVIDREGNCAYIVRESDKAWTQAAANPVSISVEIVNSGREGTLISGAGRAKLERVIADSIRRWDIPARAGAVSGCTVARAGIVDHASLGLCGGGHVDVNPYRSELPGIIADVSKLVNAGKITATDRRTCAKLNAWRRAGRPRGGRWEQNSVRRKRALTARRVVCTPTGPRK